MPCTYYTPGEEVQIVSKELNEATRNACGFAQLVEFLLKSFVLDEDEDVVGQDQVSLSLYQNLHLHTSMSKTDAKAAVNWWLDHKKKDAKQRMQDHREKRSRAMAMSVISRLSPEERETLLSQDVLTMLAKAAASKTEEKARTVDAKITPVTKAKIKVTSVPKGLKKLKTK
jgi:murein L,D-transpeptidase YafK